MKLRSKINLYTTVLFIFLLLLINGTIYFTFSKMLLSGDLSRTKEEAVKTVKGITQVDPLVPTGDLLRAYAPARGMLQIVKSDGRVDAGITDPEHQSLTKRTIQYYENETKEIIQLEEVSYTFVSIPIIWNDGEIANLQMIENLSSTVQTLRILRIVLLAVTLLAFIPVFLSSRLLSNLISRPITLITQTMREVRKSGKYKQIELPKKSKDELYQMGETFNEMIQQLQVNYERQETFVSNASHEFKTPLTIIESYASLLKRRGRDNNEIFNESIEAIHSEAIRMRELTQQLLLLAKNEEHWNVVLEEVSLRNVVEKSLQSFRIAYNREFNFFVDQDVIIQADENKLKQLIYIIMDNARKYSEKAITVLVKSEPGTGILEISDEGVGIANRELPKVFDRFYRIDQARTRKTGGFGLGLSLAREIANSMRAEIQIFSVEHKGTTVQIQFKLAESH